MSDIQIDLDYLSTYTSLSTSISLFPSSLLTSLLKILYSSKKPKPIQKLKTHKTPEKIVPLFAPVIPPSDFSHSFYSSCFVPSSSHLYNIIDSDKLAYWKIGKQPSTGPTFPKHILVCNWLCQKG